MEIHDISIFWGSHKMDGMEQDLKDLCDKIREARIKEDPFGYHPSTLPDSCMIMGILTVYLRRFNPEV